MKGSVIKPEQGLRLKKCLEYKKMTQKQLAEKTHISQQTISTIINGKTRLTDENARIFSQVLDINREYLLLESDYMTDSDHIKAVAESNVNQDIACFTLMQSLGYKFIDMKINKDGTKESMHKRYKYLRINDDDTDDQILSKAHSAIPVRYFIIEAPDGKRAHIEIDDFNRIKNSIMNFATFQLDQSFVLLRRLEEMTKNPIYES